MRKKVKERDALKYDIKLRVNQHHYDRLNKLMSASRYRNMSELLRDIVCNRQVVTYCHDESLDIVMTELVRLRKELNSIGININQISRQINSSDKHVLKVTLTLQATTMLKEVKDSMQPLLLIVAELSKKWLRK
ncbi:plasmid mobilization relaxosome protein MobC [Chitinophaga defluvii]|uniref:Plasmid mobilization relaxosome protein MobC n=1 Tax=Chitinophaga defluvii TaxID=3163343 RepID=A0ABV2T8N5_9BACT